MQKIIRWRWPLLVLWLALTVVLTIIQPDINAILHERGQNPLTADSRSVVAGKLLKEMTKTEGNSDLIVFTSDNPLSDTEMKNLESGIQELKDKQAELGFTDLIDPFTTPEAKSTLVSEDNTTVMIPFTLDIKGRSVDDIQEQFDIALKDVTVPYYLSGEDFIQNDYLKASITGVEKSAALTIIFILVVLILMFRSIIIPFVSLLAVGVSYLVSMGIAAQIIDKLNFPVTSVTQMLLVLILFGIGTDYNILLFNRFKEELAHGKSTDEAIITSYRTAGKTIVYSILTVFFAFACLSFSNFGIYKSANVVAIGTVILLLEILTLTPFIMKVLGPKLFWPSRNVDGHKESRLMGGLATFSVKRPIITVVVIAVLLIPVLLTGGQKLSFDQIEELGTGYPSTKGFSIVADKFSRGQALPTTVVIQGKEALDNNDAFGVIDELTNAIKDIPGIKSVSSITQPVGQPIDDFYISGQTAEITKGISASRDGINSIKGGLDQMQAGLTNADFSQADQLAAGTAQVKDGYEQISAALSKVASGIDGGASGAKELQSAIDKMHGGLSEIATQTSKLSGGLDKLQKGYVSAQGGFDELVGNLPNIQGGLKAMNGLIGKLGQSHSELSEDADYTTLRTTGQQLSTALASISSGFTKLQGNYKQLNTSFGSTTSGLKQLAAAQTRIVSGLNELSKGASQLSAGLKQGSSGSRELAANLKKLNTALAGIQDGQEQLNTGLGTLTGGLTELKTGLQKSSQGLGDISDGLDKTGSFLTQMGTTKTFFIPSEALQDQSFQQAMDTFLSKDRKITKMIVILDEDPYSSAALNVVEQINEKLDSGLKGTVLDGAVHGAAGPSSTTYDMNNEQLASFNNTAVIVIISVFLVLLLVIRSFLPAVYIVLSLLAAYFVGMGASKLVTAYIIGADGLSSFVPFFSFIVIVAVGVDYGIFLMMRYKEYGELNHSEAIKRAARSVGGVIISAMIILGGTFATLIPSGLVLLIELATAVIVGLVVLTFVLLPMLVPALMALPGALRDRRK
ncbi:MMPL family transporter [Paenibacillus spongiae]|uniref:MMPL family transporter n=1 Tax=Paenibacillus spongiae TaxID=2909671 RepID=A0ABY5SHH1_9BACL|nr:MMPL family transporter [Paenibacillus spongiae]UVI33214.1 MMPL family transporter [Paenibacillus spongiae]